MSDGYDDRSPHYFGVIPVHRWHLRLCPYCGGYIVWATDHKAKPVALEPWGDSEDETELHINHCACQRSLECRADPPGVEMTLSTWRGLLLLCHPDRHMNSVNEKLAASLTRWLLGQRLRLIPERENEYAE